MKKREMMSAVREAIDDVLSRSEMLQQQKLSLSFALWLEIYERINKAKEKHNDSKDKSWNG
jgi:hypothetical protein